MKITRTNSILRLQHMCFVLICAWLCLIPRYAAGDGPLYCTIEWTGEKQIYTGTGWVYEDVTGSVATNETSMSQQAALEAYYALFAAPDPDSFSEGCYRYYWTSGPPYNYTDDREVCTVGTWCELSVSRDHLPYSIIGTWNIVCQTLVTLDGLFVKSHAGAVTVAWSTASEIDNAGFNLYRSTSKEGDYIRINDDLIPAQGSATEGASYEYVDEDVRNRKTYYYKLEDIDLNGTSTMHGPVKARPMLIHVINE